MTRSKEHQEFLDIHQGRVEDTLPNDEVTTASDEEIEWWNKQKIWERRCRAQNREASLLDLIILSGEGFYYPTTPEKYRRKPLPKDSD